MPKLPKLFIFTASFLVSVLFSLFFVKSNIYAQSCPTTESVTVIESCSPVHLGGGEGYCRQTLKQVEERCDDAYCTAEYYVGGCSAYPDCTLQPGTHRNVHACGDGGTDGGGGGTSAGCPEGQVAVDDPAYEPFDYIRCQTGGCLLPNYQVDSIECEDDPRTGQGRFACHRMICIVPSPTSTPAPQPTYCQNIRAYDTNWAALTSTELSSLRAGSNVFYCIYGTAGTGSFTKARFSVNGTLMPETTTIRPDSTLDFCYLHTLPSGVTNFTIVGQLYNTVLGWIN